MKCLIRAKELPCLTLVTKQESLAGFACWFKLCLQCMCLVILLLFMCHGKSVLSVISHRLLDLTEFPVELCLVYKVNEQLR